MNDFNDFSNENQTEYMNEENPRSGRWDLGLLVIALLVGGLIWLFLSGSAPALSPDIRILTQYEDDFVFGEYTRYKLLLSNQGQAPSLSRLTVMSTLSQDAIPETVSAPVPWSCTLQPHAVNCQASGVISAGQSLPAIEITTKLPDRKENGSNGNVRICAAVNTLLDKDLSNNEICEIVTLQQAGDVVAEADTTIQEADEQNEDRNNEMADSNTSENSENEVSENDEPASEQSEDEVAENSMGEEMPATETDPTVEELASGDESIEDTNAEAGNTTAGDVESSEEEAPAEETSVEETSAEETSENTSSEEDPSTDGGQTEDEPAPQRTALVVQIGDQEEIVSEPNGQVLVPVELQPRFNDTIMTVATLEIRFDPTMLEPSACGENPDRVWEIAVCNPAFDDGVMRLSVLSTAGVSGANRIAEIEFNVIGSAGTSTPITVTPVSLVDENQEDISYKIQDSLIIIE